MKTITLQELCKFASKIGYEIVVLDKTYCKGTNFTLQAWDKNSNLTVPRFAIEGFHDPTPNDEYLSYQNCLRRVYHFLEDKMRSNK